MDWRIIPPAHLLPLVCSRPTPPARLLPYTFSSPQYLLPADLLPTMSHTLNGPRSPILNILGSQTKLNTEGGDATGRKMFTGGDSAGRKMYTGGDEREGLGGSI
ncbi:hypothetical protein Fcan01_20805 [Folsomia candida]|uniref:Uncharacterized protein n=1 Tax=Folsomia candida TaxID=158441 RepID=A0A226DFH4_FOLCA|nr:hypothetical protein Fcan01_20805 [Folsomia candida]